MNAPASIDPELAFPTDTADLASEITHLAASENALRYQSVRKIAEFDRRSGWASWGTKSCAHWLNWKCGISLGPARERIRVGYALEGLPKICAAFASGQLSYSKVRAMTRIATPETEDSLLNIARYGAASHMEKLVRKTQRATRQKSNEQYDKRSLRYHWDEQGNVVIHAVLPAEQGALFIKALKATTELLKEEERHELIDPNAEFLNENDSINVSAETQAETETAAESAYESVKAKYGVEHLRPEHPDIRANRKADALALMAANHLAHFEQGCSTSDNYQVVIHADIGKDHDTCYLENGTALAPETVQRVCCDASVSALLSNSLWKSGEPISIGRKSRTIPPPMRRALQVRDRGCQFPGCNATHYVDGHHIEHWAHGGETSLDNLVLLCRHHHRLVHEGGFGVRRSAEHDSNRFIFTTPEGKDVSAEIFPMPVRYTTQIDPEPWSWNGDKMDYGIAVDGLLRRLG